MDREDWQATVHKVAKSHIWMKQFSNQDKNDYLYTYSR